MQRTQRQLCVCGSPFRIYKELRLCIGAHSHGYCRSPRVYRLRAVGQVEEQVLDHHRYVSGGKRDTSAEELKWSIERNLSLKATHVKIAAQLPNRKITMDPATNPAPDAHISTSDALKYWNSISTTVGGMLGGYPEISRTDLKGSANFFAKLRREQPSQSTKEGALQRGVDCGAGIGRVTAGFLSTVCEVVDVVEPVEKFAREVQGQKIVGSGSVGKVYVAGLEDWVPEAQYDLIWHQWCLGHLTDEQLLAYFERCKKALTIDGWIIVKENMCTNLDGKDAFDQQDSSVTRTDQKFRRLFKEADMRLIKTELQRGFPKGLYPVRFYALKP